MKIKLIILLFISTLYSINAYSQIEQDTIPSTGGQVLIPIEFIRKADSVIISHNYLKQEVIYKDSIIKQFEILADNYRVDADIYKYHYEKERKKKNIILYTSIGAIVALTLGLIFK